MYKRCRKGFTLIELLVVISIIGLLSSVVLASLATARMKARDSKRISDIRAISVAINMYADQNGRYPLPLGCTYDVSYCFAYSYSATGWNALATSLSPYLNKLPVDPINTPCAPWTPGVDCYSYSYGNVGTGVITADNINGVTSYDIEALLETPNHPMSARYMTPKYNFYKGTKSSANHPQEYIPEMR